MPFLIAVALGIGAFVIWTWSRRGTGARASASRLFRKSDCKWRATGEVKTTLAEYRCAACGIAAYSRTGKAPTMCKKNLRGGL
jgi:hypothetical protein